MVSKQNASLKTINIPADGIVKWNDVNKDKSLKFKNWRCGASRKVDSWWISNHLNQAEGTLLTIEPFVSLICIDSYIIFSEKLLKGTADLSKLNTSITVAKYLKSLKRKKRNNNNRNRKNNTIRHIHWKEVTTTSPSERYLEYMYSLLKHDGTQYSDEVQEFRERIISLHHTITPTALLNTTH